MSDEYCPIERFKWLVTVAGDTEILVPPSNKKIRVHYFQLSSYTDDLVISLHERGKEKNAIFYGKTKAGSIVVANLLGTNYRTETFDKPIDMNLSGVGEVYLVLHFSEI